MIDWETTNLNMKLSQALDRIINNNIKILWQIWQNHSLPNYVPIKIVLYITTTTTKTFSYVWKIYLNESSIFEKRIIPPRHTTFSFLHVILYQNVVHIIEYFSIINLFFYISPLFNSPYLITLILKKNYL